MRIFTLFMYESETTQFSELLYARPLKAETAEIKKVETIQIRKLSPPRTLAPYRSCPWNGVSARKEKPSIVFALPCSSPQVTQ